MNKIDKEFEDILVELDDEQLDEIHYEMFGGNNNHKEEEVRECFANSDEKIKKQYLKFLKELK